MKECFWTKIDKGWKTECNYEFLHEHVDENYEFCPYCGKPIDLDIQDCLLCSVCSGSGEGQYDGQTCRSCGGTGIQSAERTEMRKEAKDFFKDV